MASGGKIFQARASNYYYITPGSENPINAPDNTFEFDEAEIWNSNAVPTLESKKTVPSSRSSKKVARKMEMAMDRTPMVTCASSLPVNIPDWSKIYKGEYREHQKKENYGILDDDDTDYDDDGDQDGRVPPHEYLAMKRGASFSVHEGIGRTLKGRDLRQVRNAIWKKVGFED